MELTRCHCPQAALFPEAQFWFEPRNHAIAEAIGGHTFHTTAIAA
jgi:hypothetical protein